MPTSNADFVAAGGGVIDPPAEPDAFRLLARQRGLITIEQQYARFARRSVDRSGGLPDIGRNPIAGSVKLSSFCCLPGSETPDRWSGQSAKEQASSAAF